MWKKISVTILLIFSLCCLVACNQSESGEKNNTDTVTNNKVLIAYFSATGITKRVAETITDVIGGSLYEITPAIPYTQQDLNYNDNNSRANIEQRNPNSRPGIDGEIEGMEEYDVVFIGYPIWHGNAPKIIYSFLESYDFSGKKIVPFCTSSSSGIGSSDTDLHALTVGAEWLRGTRLARNVSEADISAWLGDIGVNIVDDVSKFDLLSGTNGNAPTVKLNSGYEMPILGLGTYSLHGDTAKNSVLSALRHGVRLIDTAYMYGNEAEIGEAIRESGVPREEIFVITKIYPGEQFANPDKAIQDALNKLNIGYIDMMLLHHPGVNDVQAYKAMEKYVATGKIRSLGLSNWYIEEIDGFISKVSIMPALIQNEIHPFYQEKQVVPYMHKLGIVMQAWYPFGGRGHTGAIFNNETIKSIAEAHSVTSAQIVLRWHLQRGVVAIPGSSNPEHILENISVFDFNLTEAEMNAIAALDRNEKHDWY